MDETPMISARPPNKEEEFIKEKYLESLTNQPALMDDIARQILTVELATPALYASILKLIHGKDATVIVSPDIYGVFIFWLCSLIFIIFALLPRKYKVNINDHTEIRNSFYITAKYKLNWIILSILTFSAGLFFVLKDLIS